MMRDRNRGFTLVELLVVIAIIGILAGMILAGLYRVRVNARIAQCKNNLQNFSKAVDIFRGNHDDDFPDFLSNLYTSYIDAKEVYICPSDKSVPKGSEGGKPPHEPTAQQFAETDDNLNNSNPLRNSKIEYCSYLYEFCGAECSWKPGYSWKEAKLEEIQKGSTLESGGTVEVWGHVPLVRCFWHITPDGTGYKNEKRVINVAVEDRNIFMSGAGVDDWKEEF